MRFPIAAPLTANYARLWRDPAGARDGSKFITTNLQKLKPITPSSRPFIARTKPLHGDAQTHSLADKKELL